MPLKDLIKKFSGSIYSPFSLAGKKRIIYFHSVHPDYSFSLHPLAFKAIISTIIDEGYSILSVSDLMSSCDNEKAIAISFDDGYFDNLEFAVPILLEYSANATFFVVTDLVGESGRIGSNVGHRMYPNRPMLNAQDIRYMSDLGFEIGSHTANHLSLRHLYKASPLLVHNELTNSKIFLEDVTGSTVESFAYPFGQPMNVSHDVTIMAHQAGYKYVFGTHWGAADDDYFTARCCIPEFFSEYDIKNTLAGCNDYLSFFGKIPWRGRQWYNKPDYISSLNSYCNPPKN
jgi:peptidoglycan/xylan/chitin deacetylase (PgdA/CDA1 family)